METSNQYLETEPVGKLMARYSVPSSFLFWSAPFIILSIRFFLY